MTLVMLCILAAWCVFVTAGFLIHKYRMWKHDEEWREIVKRLDE